MAAHDTAALAGMLATIVVPNYPCLDGTDIPVMDVRECARRGTPEQRATAKHARDVMAEIWTLDEKDPVFRLLEGITKAQSSAMDSTDVARLETEGLLGGRTLPNELMHRVLFFFVVDDEEVFDDVELLLLCTLRSVSKATKEYAETRCPNTFARYVYRVVRHWLHVAWQHDNVKIAKLALQSAPLLGRVRRLRVFFYGDEAEPLSAILGLCTNLRGLQILVPSMATRLDGLLRYGCHHLCIMCIGIAGLTSPGFANLLPSLRDIFAPRDFDPFPVQSSHRFSCRSLKMCRINGLQEMVGGEAQPGLLASLREQISEHVEDLLIGDHPLRREDISSFWDYFDTEGPPTLSLQGCGLTDDAVVGLGLEHKGHLTTLILSRNRITNPAALALDGEASSIEYLDLACNPLASGTFGLATNSHLRYLNLANSLLELEAATRVLTLRALVNDLRTNTTLRRLNLASNLLGAPEARELRMLRENTGLRVLSLATNDLTDDDLRIILDGNTSLRFVDVRWNTVSEKCATLCSISTRRILQDADAESYGWDEDEVDSDSDSDSDVDEDLAE